MKPTGEQVKLASEIIHKKWRQPFSNLMEAEQLAHFLAAHVAEITERVRRETLEEAAREADSWGDQCAGGSGGEIIQSGPSKGQRYGEGYYNLANKIRTLASLGRG